MSVKIAIFASGGGSNALKIIEHFRGSELAEVALVVSNKRGAGVLDVAARFGIPTAVIDRKQFYETEEVLALLRQHDIGFVALAGFLWLVPPYLVRAFPRRMLNIHPALLPKFGGRGMWGRHVHEAVRAAGETESGPTIHYVNEHYDEGDVVFQAKCPIAPEDSAEDIAAKVLALEHRYYPKVIEEIVRPLAKPDAQR